MKVIWSPTAFRDAREYWAYIRSDNAPAADNWLATVMGKVDLAAQFPRLGQVAPDFGD